MLSAFPMLLDTPGVWGTDVATSLSSVIFFALMVAAPHLLVWLLPDSE